MDTIHNPAEVHKRCPCPTDVGGDPAQTSSCVSPWSEPPRRSFLVMGGKSPGSTRARISVRGSPLLRMNSLRPFLLSPSVPLFPFC